MSINKSLQVLELDKKILVELMVAGIEFVFKGGTSLHLRYPEVMKRISQDTDIAIRKENFDETIENIKMVLESMGLTVERIAEPGDYGVVYRINDNNSVFTRLDIASYSEFDKIIKSNEFVKVNGIEIKMFDQHITFIEKLLAIHSWFIEVDNQFIDPSKLTGEQIRKMRHILDIYELFTHKIIVFDDKTLPLIRYFTSVAMVNEIKGHYFENINHLSDLIEFHDDFFKKIKDLFELWDGDDYHDGATKPTLEQVKRVFDVLKNILKEVRYNEN